MRRGGRARRGGRTCGRLDEAGQPSATGPPCKGQEGHHGLGGAIPGRAKGVGTSRMLYCSMMRGMWIGLHAQGQLGGHAWRFSSRGGRDRRQPKDSRSGTGRPEQRAIGTDAAKPATRRVGGVRGLAMEARGYAAAVYPWRDVARTRKVATCPRETIDRTWRLAACAQGSADMPRATTHHDAGQQQSVHPQVQPEN
jgi:hypothetical protein